MTSLLPSFISRSFIATALLLANLLLASTLAVAGDTGAADGGAKVPAAQIQSAPVNLNTADVQTLARLNGVGEKKAADIIAYREAHGRFNTVEDLLQVKGIGERTLEKNRNLLTVK